MKIVIMSIASALIIVAWTVFTVLLSQWVVTAFPNVGKDGTGGQLLVTTVMILLGVAISAACFLSIVEEFDK